MPKRKKLKKNVNEAPRSESDSGSAVSDTSDQSEVEVDLEFFDPQPQDYTSIKLLLRYLFGPDHTEFDLGSVSDVILSQPLLGSTVKVDGNLSDPFAILSVLNLQHHKKAKCVTQISDYLLNKAKLHARQEHQSLFAEALDIDSNDHTAIVLSERLINMPKQIAGPMYNMLLEEIDWALLDGEPYNFTRFVIVSKSYREVDEEADPATALRSLKKKQKPTKPTDDKYHHFQVEDELFLSQSSASFFYPYTHKDEETESKAAFQQAGIATYGFCVLMDVQQFRECATQLTKEI